MKNTLNLNIALAVFVLLLVDLVALSYGASTLSISANEARVYFFDKNLLHYTLQASAYLFGENDFAIRIPFLFFHFCSCLLLFALALKLTKTAFDAFLSLLLFILLPGTVVSALLANEASYVIFLSLCILCAYEYDKKLLFYVLLLLSVFVDKSFYILFLALFFYALYKKDALLLCVNFILIVSSLYMYGFIDTSGRPQGYFLDTLGIFAACFSPLVFVYFFYVIYRLSLKGNKPLLWFIMSVTFIFCSLLSIRQKIYLDDFLPFCVICTPLLISTLMSSYRVRLPKFRLKYDILIQCSLIFLVLFYLLIIFNTSLYMYIKNPSKHFANDYHIAKELASELKKHKIYAINTKDSSMQLRLRFYGISNSSTLYLQKSKAKNSDIELSLGALKQYYKIQRKT
ncbi:hypothetical protein [Campylobacter avium]|uniref:hypothetical protein n=1 Tax=Campylobacter avium TaxID=522485 RepID=UPI00255B56EB|nr:hypothetical protein [Campylobacter avium]